MFRQDRTNPSTAVSNWKGRRDSKKGHPSTAVSTWLNGGLFGGPMEYTTTGSPTVTLYGAYTSLTFTSSGNFVITTGTRDIEFCVIGGGGTGGSMAGGGGGGGGAGGMYVGVAAGLTVGTHTTSVGSGGSGWTAGFWSYGQGRVGTASNFTPDGESAFTANGGGGGGYLTTQGQVGGCGGGGGADSGSTPLGGNPQGGSVTGFKGGNGDGATPTGYDWGGGGGGTAAAGQDAWDYSAGTGGNGATNDYGTGVAVQRAGGGGGTSSNGLPSSARDRLGGGGGGTQGFAGQAPLAAAANTGSGVGGCDRGWGQGNGGSGIVILRWLT